jgi:hypothetical protein
MHDLHKTLASYDYHMMERDAAPCSKYLENIALTLHTCRAATNINSSTSARWIDRQPLQLGRSIDAHCNMSLFSPLAARLMQCTRPQAADWLARRRRIDQEMETQRQTQPPQKRTRFAKRSSSRTRPECRLRWDRRRSFHVSK